MTRHADGPQRLFTDDDRTLAVTCRYCRAPCTLLVVFAEAVTTWNLTNRGAHKAIEMDEICACDACYPRWLDDVAALDRRRQSDVGLVLRDIHDGQDPMIPEWMRGFDWAMVAIRKARKARAEGKDTRDSLG